MSQWVAFLRAVNVAGHAKARMADVRAAFAAAGAKDVSTYIQSGNVVFSATQREHVAVVGQAQAELTRVLGAEPTIILRRLDRLAAALNAAPFGGAAPPPEIKWYVAFLATAPKSPPALPLRSEQEALEAVARRDKDVFVVSRRKRNGMFGFPNQFVEGALGVVATSRNWTTLTKLVGKAADR